MDLVVCQFGVMFYPDKVCAHQEARRILRSNGHYLLVSFDRLEHTTPFHRRRGPPSRRCFPTMPAYTERGPFSYADPALIERHLLAAGFTRIQLETVALATGVIARMPLES